MMPVAEPQNMDDAPRDGTQILAWLIPEPVRRLDPKSKRTRLITRQGRYALVRWFQHGDAPGYWSAHHKGQGKVDGDPLAWWPLPERRAS